MKSTKDNDRNGTRKDHRNHKHQSHKAQNNTHQQTYLQPELWSTHLAYHFERVQWKLKSPSGFLQYRIHIRLIASKADRVIFGLFHRDQFKRHHDFPSVHQLLLLVSFLAINPKVFVIWNSFGAYVSDDWFFCVKTRHLGPCIEWKCFVSDLVEFSSRFGDEVIERKHIQIPNLHSYPISRRRQLYRKLHSPVETPDSILAPQVRISLLWFAVIDSRSHIHISRPFYIRSCYIFSLPYNQSRLELHRRSRSNISLNDFSGVARPRIDINPQSDIPHYHIRRLMLQWPCLHWLFWKSPPFMWEKSILEVDACLPNKFIRKQVIVVPALNFQYACAWKDSLKIKMFASFGVGFIFFVVLFVYNGGRA